MQPGLDPLAGERVVATLYGLSAWARLGSELASRGPHRLLIAARAARAAAAGGLGVDAAEEDQIAQWFTRIVDEAIHRDGLRAAAAIWFVLVGDGQADPFELWYARCPGVAMVPEPPHGYSSDPASSPDDAPDPAEAAAFLAKLRAAAASYIRTAIAGASETDLIELRLILHATDAALEEYRPWGPSFAEGSPAHASLEAARSTLTRRQLSNADACSGLAEWAHGFAGMVVEHSLSPVFRIGAIAWFARVALRDEERAA